MQQKDQTLGKTYRPTVPGDIDLVLKGFSYLSDHNIPKSAIYK